MEATRRLNITFEIPDNDQIQYNFEKLLNTIIGESKIKDLRVLQNTDSLKDDETYLALYKKQKKSKNEYYDYITNHKK